MSIMLSVKDVHEIQLQEFFSAKQTKIEQKKNPAKPPHPTN